MFRLRASRRGHWWLRVSEGGHWRSCGGVLGGLGGAPGSLGRLLLIVAYLKTCRNLLLLSCFKLWCSLHYRSSWGLCEVFGDHVGSWGPFGLVLASVTWGPLGAPLGIPNSANTAFAFVRIRVFGDSWGALWIPNGQQLLWQLPGLSIKTKCALAGPRAVGRVRDG